MMDLLLALTSVLTLVVLLSRLHRLELHRSRLSAELSRASQSKDSMSAASLLTSEMSHMLISPLTVILGQCELARGSAESHARLDTIEKQARRMAVVIERFRGVGQEDRREIRRVDPAACARSVLDSLQGMAEERDVTIHEMIETCPQIEADPALIKHALRHLLRTAIQAAPEGIGDVTLAVGVMPADNGRGHVMFAVADDGPGIPPEQLPRVFHPFPEAGANVRGEGFSYAVVYALARAMGASVVVDSAPGAGTRATLKVPLEKRAPVESLRGAVSIP